MCMTMLAEEQFKISSCGGLGKGDVKFFMSPETLKVQKETLPMEEGLFLVFY